MRTKLFYILSLLVVAVALLLFGLRSTPLNRSTEQRVAGIATQMYLDGNYVVPQLNGRPFLEKPPLHAWLTAASFHVLGVSAGSSRVVSVVAALITLLLVMNFAEHHHARQPVPVLVALCLATMVQYWGFARFAGQEVLLTLGVTLALLSSYNYSSTLYRPFLFCVALGVAIASLTKGVFGIAITVGTAFGYEILKALFIEKRFSVKPVTALFMAVCMGLIPLIIWIWLLYRQEGWAAFYEVAWVNSVGRFLGKFEGAGHVRPWYFYIVRLPLLFQPWLLLVLLGLYQAFKRLRRSHLGLFYICWLLIPFFMLTISAGKRMSYTLIIYPAAALLTGSVIAQYLGKDAMRISDWSKAMKKLLFIQGIISSAALLGCCAMAIRMDREHAGWLVLPIAAAGASVLGWRAYRRGNPRVLFACNFVVIGMLLLFYGGAIEVQQCNEHSLADLFDGADSCHVQIVLYRPSETLSGAAVFHLLRVVPELKTADEFAEFTQGNTPFIAISKNRELKKMDNNAQCIQIQEEDYYILIKQFDTQPLQGKFPFIDSHTEVENGSYHGKGYQDTQRRVSSIRNAKRCLNREPKNGLEKSIPKTLDLLLEQATESDEFSEEECRV